MSARGARQTFGPWNPGIDSTIPARLLPRSTMFDDSSRETGYTAARERADFCGLAPHEVAIFSPERLIVHELLIRVTADLSVPDGPEYQELGINMRGMTAAIHDGFVEPELDGLKDAHKSALLEARRFMEDAIKGAAARAAAKPAKPRRSFWRRLLPFAGNEPAAKVPLEERDHAIAETLRGMQTGGANEFDTACLAALLRAVDAVLSHRGRLPADRSLLLDLACGFFGNGYGSRLLGEKLQPIIERAATANGYRFLPAQEKPVVMNVKGASASGKSTIRPLQRELAERIEIPWQDFALISPDYWRKYLLDYDTLGDDHKYGAMLTGHELEIIDRKLDRYMADKAARHAMPHLLIDRFRFDSFSTADQLTEAGRLLSRFGDTIYLFFMITPPEATVERAWSRGLSTGRYKSVDDLLHHNVEAYEGINQLFFSWVLRGRKKVHFEFLDNDVSKGERPKTIAFGWNNDMCVVDIAPLIDIERYAKINVDATNADRVYDGSDISAKANTSFLKQCAELLRNIDFVDPGNGYIYGRMKDGEWLWLDADHVRERLTDEDDLAGLEGLGWDGKQIGNRPEPDHAELPTKYCVGAPHVS